VGVHDWDTLAWQPEAALAGAANVYAGDALPGVEVHGELHELPRGQ
jgi:hypothetical protein